ncbi:hypothetical protein F5B19DRAFT_353571 [Rostrohypoxylon terebratum]|nr:hypothetical protein F5B19DRAFT_353571 [Rostrohypoxylon terebratum]
MGHDEIVEMLMEKGANPSLLCYGVCGCKFPIALSRDTWLCRYSTKVEEETDHMPCSALHLALSGLHLSTAKLIIDYGAPMYLTERLPWEYTGRKVLPSHAPSIIYRIFDDPFQDSSRLMQHLSASDAARTVREGAERVFHNRIWCREWLIAKEFVNPNPVLEEVAPFHHMCLSEVCELISYAIDIQMTWKEHNILTPLIHMYLQRPWVPLPDWRRPGARLKIERIEQFAKRSLLLLEHQLDTRADIEARDPNDYNSTPIMAAALNGDLSIFNLLISHGANVNAADDSGYTALHAACVSTRAEIIAKLLMCGAKVNAVTRDGMSPLHFLCCTISADRRAEVPKLIRLLLSYGADPTLRVNRACPFFRQARSALEASLSRLSIDVSRLLFSKFNGVFSKPDIWTLFRVMLRSPHSNGLRLIIQFDRQKFILRDEEFLYHLLRSRKHNNHLVNVLLECGIAFNGTARKDGSNTVFWAVKRQKGHKLLGRLLAGGVSPNVVVNIGKSQLYPLIEAIKLKDEKHRRKYVDLLVKYGANFALLPDSRPLHTEITGYQPWRELESVADILFSPQTLQQVSEAQRIKLMNDMFQLPGIKILRLILVHSSSMLGNFAAQYADALPIWILDVAGYQSKYKLTIEHFNIAISIFRAVDHFGVSWESRDSAQRRVYTMTLQQLMNPPRTETIRVGASWCLRKRIKIIDANSEFPKIQIAAPCYSPLISKKITLYRVGREFQREH